MAKDLDPELIALVRRTNCSDVDDDSKAELESYFERDRGAAQVLGTPAHHVRQELLKELSTGSACLREAIQANLSHIETELGWKTSTGAERLLIDNILTCWVWVQHAEAKMNVLVRGSHSFAQGKYWQDTLDRAHGRFNRAIQSLANYRKVAIYIQINVAQQQVNAQSMNVAPTDSRRVP